MSGEEVPEERLHRAEWRSYCVQQRRVGVAQGVPANFRNLQLFAYGNELTIRQIATAERSAFLRAEHKQRPDRRLGVADPTGSPLPLH